MLLMKPHNVLMASRKYMHEHCLGKVPYMYVFVWFVSGEVERSQRSLQVDVDRHVVAADEQAGLGHDELGWIAHTTGAQLPLHNIILYVCTLVGVFNV